MRLKVCIGICLTACLFVCSAQNARASVWVSEILADPSSSLTGDANNDGVTSTRNDEFVELFNDGESAVNLSGWSLTDAQRVRHVFQPDMSIDPYGYLVIFAGGAPNLSGVSWQIASTGSLALNNGGDTVSLYDTQNFLIDQVDYGPIGGHDQSIARNLNALQDDWMLISDSKEYAGAYFTPGTGLYVQPEISNTVAPEPATALTFLFGLMGSARYFRRKG